MGQSFSVAHLAPFVDISRKNYERQVDEESTLTGINYTPEQKKEIVEKRLRKEIESGVQTIQYQIITLMTTNGQAPFVSAFMYLNEVPEGSQLQKDLAMIIEEMLKQRIKGVKNEKGFYVTPAFPKLLYVLDENNIHEDSEFYYLTKLAAQCTAKRMVPDYISAKIMKEVKDGNVFPCMGSVLGSELVTYKIDEKVFVTSIENMWKKLRELFFVQLQNPMTKDSFISLNNVKIWDNKLQSFVECKCITKNKAEKWIKVTLGSRIIVATHDHKFETENRGEVFGYDLVAGDKILVENHCNLEEKINTPSDKAWLLGLLLGAAHMSKGVLVFSVYLDEKEEEKFYKTFEKYFHASIKSEINKTDEKEVKYYYITRMTSDDDKSMMALRYFEDLFDGLKKTTKTIPNEVFYWNKEAKSAFVSGIIDAVGFIVPESGRILISSENRQMLLQTMKLVQSLGINVSNWTNKKNRDEIQFYAKDENTFPEITNVKKNEIVKSGFGKTVVVEDVESVTRVEEYNPNEIWSYDVTTESGHFEVSGIYSHNCRSFLMPYNDENGKPKFYGRLNTGVVTVSLPDIALSSGKDMDKFWKIFYERLDLCHRALRIRHNRLYGIPSSVAPILWNNGAFARLKKGEVIDRYLEHNYSSLSLGYAGLYECVKYMTGKSHTDPEATPFAIEVMKKLKEATEEWNKTEPYGYSVYGTPIESTTYRFAKCLKKRFGVIEGVTDRNYITNSFHVFVGEQINAFDKLTFESQFQKYSTGGSVIYVEVPNMQNNLEAVLALIKHIYTTSMYAELNTKSDFCSVCNYDGEMKIIEDGNKLVWECPNCHNRDQSKMSVARRTCGYIGTWFWNQGRTQEIKERVLHL